MQMHAQQQMQLHHGPQGQQGMPPGPPLSMEQNRALFVRQSELVWIQLGMCLLPLRRRAARRQIAFLTRVAGNLAEAMGMAEEAISAYEQALRINPNAVTAMNAISVVLRAREEFPKAAEFLQAALKLDPNNGEAWGSLGK